MSAPAPDAPRNGSDLCVDCGLCCNGVLHDRIDIAGDEAELAEAGGGVLRRAEGLFTPLPCPYVAGAACTIYEKRYASCRAYQCALLKAFLAGDVGLDEAEARVAEAKRLLANVRTFLPAGGLLSEARAEWRKRANDPTLTAEEKAASARLQLHMTMLNMFLDRHFRLDREGQSVTRRA